MKRPSFQGGANEGSESSDWDDSDNPDHSTSAVTWLTHSAGEDGTALRFVQESDGEPSQ